MEEMVLHQSLEGPRKKLSVNLIQFLLILQMSSEAQRNDIKFPCSLVAELDPELSSGGPNKVLYIWPHCLFKCLAITPPRWQFHGNNSHEYQMKLTIHFVTGKKISKVIDTIELDILFTG